MVLETATSLRDAGVSRHLLRKLVDVLTTSAGGTSTGRNVSIMFITTTGLEPSPSAGPAVVLRGLISALASLGYEGSAFVAGGNTVPEDREYDRFVIRRLVSSVGIRQRLRIHIEYGLEIIGNVFAHDILIFNSPPRMVGMGVVVFARLLGKPVILVVHGGLFMEDQHRLRRKLDTRLLSTCRSLFSRVVCVSDWMAELVTPMMGADHVSVVRNGHYSEVALAGERPKGEKKRPTILLLGRLVPIKRPMDALGALSILAESLDVELIVAGGGELQKTLEDTVRQAGLSNRVRIVGHVVGEAKARLLSDAHVLLLPSQAESFGLVILEAWDAGLAVVAARAGGIPEVIEDGKTGLLVPVGDIEGYAEALRLVLTNEERRQELVTAGQERLRDYFNWRRAGADYDTVIRSLL